MGIFSKIANSDGGAFLQGVLDEADNIARQDAQTNAVVAQNALNKENEAYKLTELAYKHKNELIKTVIENADELGIVGGELTVAQIADRLVGKVFNNQRSIFELPNFASVSNAFAKSLAKTPGEEIILKNPYIPSEDLFNQEAEKHSARISAITKMPKADKLLHNIKKAEEKVESPEAIFNKAMTIAPLSAKAYGILGYYPDSKEGRDALGFMKSSLIVANSRFYHPDDPNARAQFIEKKLFENQIDPFAALQFTNPMNFRQITSVLDQMSSNVSNKMLMLTNQMNAAGNEKARLEIKDQIDNLILEQMKQVNNASKVATMQIAGRNVPVDQSMISTEAPILDDSATGAQIETGERKIKPQRFGSKKITITQDDPKEKPRKKESILTPGLKLKKRNEVDTTEEIKGTTTEPNPGAGGIPGSRGLRKKSTVKVDEQESEAMIQSDDAQVMQANIFNRYNQKDVNTIFQNNNPGNVKVSSDWQGETYTGSKGNVYKKYATKAEGLGDILKTISKYNKTNLKDIMSIYATDDASGKVVKDYAGILQRDHDVPKVIDFTNDEHLESLLKGIVHIENSVIKYKNRNYRKAYRQYYKDKDYFDAIDSFLGGTKA